MKKAIYLVLALSMLLCVFTGCDFVYDNTSEGTIIISIIVFWVYMALLAVTAYIAVCSPQEKMAKKLGVSSSWMSYVPIARNIQKMKMAKLPMWKLFFVGNIATKLIVSGLIYLIWWAVDSIHESFAIVVATLLGVTYLVFYIITTYQYYEYMTEKFEYDKLFAVVLTLLGVATGFLDIPFLYLFAFDNRRTGTPGSAPVPGPRPGPAPGPIPGPSAGPAGIEGVFGMYAGAQFEIKGADVFTIGRDGTLSNIIISSNGDKVSKRHCSIRFSAQEGCYEVTDFSSNGTFYGNSRLVRDIPTKLPRGTVLILGDKTNQFKLM